MSEPFVDSPLLNQINPEQHVQHNKFPNPEVYKLNQSHFTKQQLLAQDGYQIIEKDQFIYFGGTYNNVKHGWGVLVTKHTVYEGKFSLNHKMGKGYLRYANGSVYIGNFTNDKPHGQGFMEFNQQYYIGDFENGCMQGDGLWRNKLGDKYVGQWKANKAQGYGIYVSQKSHYQGQFFQFSKHGYGVQNFVNGDTYKGNYNHGKPKGYGQYSWSNGSYYKGQFFEGFRQGEGIWISQNGDKYTGHFSGDRKNGQGQYLWANGNHYKGQFCQDMRQGQGQMIWNDGSIYQGQWQRGMPHGKGIFKVKGEKPHVGFFEDNVLVSQIKNASQMYAKQHHEQKRGVRDSSLILSMIPQMTKRKKFISEKKGRKRQTSSTRPSLSFMNINTKKKAWRSRIH